MSSEELKKEWSDEFDSFVKSVYGLFLSETTDRLKSFISSLLAKQQEEFVNMIEKLKSDVHTKQIGTSDYQVGKLRALDDLLADIKSKLNI